MATLDTLCNVTSIGTAADIWWILEEGDPGLVDIRVENPDPDELSDFGVTVPSVPINGDGLGLFGIAAGVAGEISLVAHDQGGSGLKTERASNVWSVDVESIPEIYPYIVMGTLTGAAGDDEAELDWPASTKCDVRGDIEYRVERSTTGPSSGFSDLGVQISATDYADTTAVNGTTYWYRIRGVWVYGSLEITDMAGGPNISNAVAVTPAAAGGLTVNLSGVRARRT